MAIICREHGLLFIMAPRTGCTAIGAVLQSSLGGVKLPEERIIDSRGMIAVDSKHSSLEELTARGLVTPEDLRSLLVFTAVRNPFDSLVSLYAKMSGEYQSFLDDPESWVHKIPNYAEQLRYAKDHSFQRWLIKKCWRVALGSALGRGGRSLFDRYTSGAHMIMRFEDLDRDFAAVLSRAGLSSEQEIPRVNTTQGRVRDYRQYYSPLTRALVAGAYKRDLDSFDYAF